MRYRNNGDPYTAWHAGFCIAKTDKEARLWFRGKPGGASGITGDGTIDGLLWAFHNLEDMVTELEPNDCVSVEGEDLRRHRAYRGLLRRGWERGHYSYYKNGGRC